MLSDIFPVYNYIFYFLSCFTLLHVLKLSILAAAHSVKCTIDVKNINIMDNRRTLYYKEWSL